jgi:uncharacterized protein
MIVVSNTSPLTNLAAIGRFELLRKLFGEIHIAHGVWEELNKGGRRHPGSREVENASWVHRREVSDQTVVAVLRRESAGRMQGVSSAGPSSSRSGATAVPIPCRRDWSNSAAISAAWASTAEP